MKHTQTFKEFLNESTLEISGNAYTMWNDKKIQRELDPLKFKIVGDMKGVMTLSGNEEELNKVKAIFGIKESVNEGSSNTEILDLVDQIQKVIKDLKADTSRSKSDVDKLYTLSSPFINQLHKLI